MRGHFRNRDHAKQLCNFSGMRWGTITPTDLDAFIEFEDRVYIFVEIKHGGKKPEGGQKLAFERLCDLVGKTKSCLFIVGRSDADLDEDVFVHACPVIWYRFNGQWREPYRDGITVKEMVDDFLERNT